jgi:hypothetical protein
MKLAQEIVLRFVDVGLIPLFQVDGINKEAHIPGDCPLCGAT